MSLSNIKVNNSTVIIVDDEPTAGSDNLIKSRGIYNQIAGLGVSNNQDLNKILLELYLESEQFGNWTNATISFMKAHLYNGRYYNGINVFSTEGQQYGYDESFSSETEAINNLKSLFIKNEAYFLINWQLVNNNSISFQYISFNCPYSLENNQIIYSSLQLNQYKEQNEERFDYSEQIKPIKNVNNGYMNDNGLVTETGYGCDYYLAEQIPSGSTFISRVTSGQMYTIFYFDIDFNYLSKGYMYYTSPQTIEGIITKPENAAYIVINRGSAETTSVIARCKITNIKESIKDSKPVNNSQSIIVNLGDSLFAMGRDEGTSISDFLKERIGGKIYNCALGGDTMSRWYESWQPTPAGWSEFALVTLIDSIVAGDYSLQEQTLEDYPSTFPSYFSDVLNTLKQIDFSLVNIITISLGTNDYGCDVGIYNSSQPTSKSYFKSSYKYVLDTLFNAFPNIRVILCTPLVRGDRTSPNGQGAVLSDFADCVKDLGKEYNSPVCDFYYEMGVNQHNLNSFFFGNLVHPQVYGREKMANKLSQKLYEF